MKRVAEVDIAAGSWLDYWIEADILVDSVEKRRGHRKLQDARLAEPGHAEDVSVLQY